MKPPNPLKGALEYDSKICFIEFGRLKGYSLNAFKNFLCNFGLSLGMNLKNSFLKYIY